MTVTSDQHSSRQWEKSRPADEPEEVLREVGRLLLLSSTDWPIMERVVNQPLLPIATERLQQAAQQDVDHALRVLKFFGHELLVEKSTNTEQPAWITTLLESAIHEDLVRRPDEGTDQESISEPWTYDAVFRHTWLARMPDPARDLYLELGETLAAGAVAARSQLGDWPSAKAFVEAAYIDLARARPWCPEGTLRQRVDHLLGRLCRGTS